jgi:hypothetical protein
MWSKRNFAIATPLALHRHQSLFEHMCNGLATVLAVAPIAPPFYGSRSYAFV